MTAAAGLPSMLDREELIGQTMHLRSQHAELQQRAEASRKVTLSFDGPHQAMILGCCTSHPV